MPIFAITPPLQVCNGRSVNERERERERERENKERKIKLPLLDLSTHNASGELCLPLVASLQSISNDVITYVMVTMVIVSDVIVIATHTMF